MISTTSLAEWVSLTYEQGQEETLWKDYQTELKTRGISALYFDMSYTRHFASAEDYTGKLLVHKADGTRQLISPAKTTVPWDINTASYANKTFAVGTQANSPYGLFFSPDGTKMWVVNSTGNSTSAVFQYTLSTPWEVNTASYASKTFTVGSQANNPCGLLFSPDGTKMWVVNSSTSTSRVHQYTLSTPWEVNTASYANKTFTVGSQATSPRGLAFSPDGTKMWVLNNNGTYSAVFQYTLSTPWEVNTAIYANKSFTVGSQAAQPFGPFFSPDGTKMWIVNSNSSTSAVFQYTLSTPWEVNTASYANKTFTVGSQAPSPQGLAFSPDGTKMWVIGSNYQASAVFQYVLASQTTETSINTASYANKTFTVGIQAPYPYGLAFSPDGTKMWVVNYTGSSTGAVFQYTLSTPWEVNTASYANKTFTVDSPVNIPQGLTFSPDGTKMWVVNYTGSSTSAVFQYTLSTPWEVNTASYASKTFTVGSQAISPAALFFSPDGTKMWVVNNSNGSTSAVFQYTLSTPWEVNTASYANKTFTVGSQAPSPQGLVFSPDGTKMWVVGSTNSSSSAVFQYTLGTPWEVNTASYASKTFVVGSLASRPCGLAFSSDGTKMWVVNSTSSGTSAVFQYSMPPNHSVYKTYYYDISSLNLTQPPLAIYHEPRSKISALLAGAPSLVKLATSSVPAVSSTLTSITVDFDNTVDRVFEVNDSISIDFASYWDLGAASYANKSLVVGSQATYPQGLFFSPDGTKMWVVNYTGSSTGAVFQYTLSTPWEVNTASYASKTFAVGSQATNPKGLFFSPDGTKMWVVNSTGNSTSAVFQYTLSTPWEVNTASYASKTFAVGNQAGSPTGLFFSPDGTKMWVVNYMGTITSAVFQYTLNTPWEVNTANYASKNFAVGNQAPYLYGLFFSPDGTKMWVVNDGNSASAVLQYALSTPWEVNTASYVNKTFTAGTQASNPYGLFFSPDGTKMWVVNNSGNSTSAVFQYTLAAPTYVGTQVLALNVSGGKTTINYPTQTKHATSIVVPDRSAVQPTVVYDIDEAGYITTKSDRIALPNGKRYAKFKIVSENYVEEVVNAKLNLWKY